MASKAMFPVSPTAGDSEIGGQGTSQSTYLGLVGSKEHPKDLGTF